MAEFCKKCSNTYGLNFDGFYPGEICEGCGLICAQKQLFLTKIILKLKLMKKIVLLLFIVFSVNFSFAQIAFENKTFENKIITICEGKNKTEIYKKTLDWVAVTFVSPEDVVMAKIENEYIRIRGTQKNLTCYHALGNKICHNARFTIEISFKDDKYKFEILELQEFSPYTNQYSTAGWYTIDLINLERFYDKKSNLRNKYKYFVEEIPLYFNNLNKNLNEFILNENIPSKSNDW